MKSKLLLIGLLLGCMFGKAQKDSKAMSWKDRFHSFNTVQVMNGSTTTSLAVNSVNGFQMGKLFCGIGTGFDYYFHVTVPLFIETRYDLVKQKGTLQVFANGGLQFAFSSQNNKFENSSGTYKTAGGYSGGLDYLMPVEGGAFILGASFSNKHVIHMADNNVWNPLLNASENIPLKENYSLNRIAIRIGWRF